MARIDGALQRFLEARDPVPSAPIAVVVRCAMSEVEAVSLRIRQLGGRVRRTIEPIGAISADLAPSSLRQLALAQGVTAIELDRELSIR